EDGIRDDLVTGFRRVLFRSAESAPAYPGGVFWLRALGNDDTSDAKPDAERQELIRREQFRSIAERLGIDVRERNQNEVEGALGQIGRASCREGEEEGDGATG